MHIGSMHPAERRSRWLGLVCVVSFSSLTLASCASAPAGVTNTDRSARTRAAIHLLNRATFGVRPKDVQEVLRIGPNAWLDRQMQPAPRVVAQTTAPPPAPSPQAPRTMMLGGQQVVVSPMPFNQNINNLAQEKLARAVRSDRQLEEVMTDFWFNHFNVFFTKTRATIADYEENAIRRHVFGRFEELLIATAQHPAMLVYLDNYQSTAPPDSTQPAPAGRPMRRGLNENYARELLELHTLGADRGYTQKDVIEVARAFTGWGIISRPVQPAQPSSGGSAAPVTTKTEFQFQRERHDIREKVVLGKTLPAGRGQEDGLDVLRMLAHHPTTADHIATKLVRHFVSDEPPQKLVDELAEVFLETGGDLRAVTRALFTSRTFNDPAFYRGKVKRPFEFMASALRVADAQIFSQGLVPQLRALGHLPYNEAAPTGYPTMAREWLSAGAMMNRMKFALALGPGGIEGSNVDRVTQFTLEDMTELSNRLNASRRSGDGEAAVLHDISASVLRRTLPGMTLTELENTIVEDLAQRTSADARALVARALGLALGSPEFQRY